MERDFGGSEIPLLDRVEEQASLRRALRDARSGRGCAVIVEGRPGIGKSSLTRAIADEARGEGWRVVTGRGSQLEQEFAFGVVRQLLAAGQVSAGGVPTRMTDVDESDGRVVHLLSDQAGSHGTQSGASEFQILHDLYWWFVRRTDAEALLVIVDDVQWVDVSSLRFLHFLTLRVDQLPLALVVAGRHVDEPGRAEIVAALAGNTATTVVEPRPLSRASVAELVRSSLGDPADQFVDACHRVSGGNPLMLTELLRELRVTDTVPSADAVHLVEGLGPSALRHHVSVRLTGRPSSYRQLAEALAILGPGVPSHVAVSLARLTPAAADEAIDGLIGLDLVCLDKGLAFTHPLLAAVVYQSIAPRRREREHERAAELLAAEHAPAERIAAHVLNIAPARRPERIPILVGAALEARRRGGNDSAAVYLRRALGEPPPEALRSEVARQLGNCEAYSLDWRTAEHHLREAVDLAKTDEHRALAAYSLGRYLEVTQRPDEGAGVLERALAELGDAVPELRARIAAEFAGYCTVVVGRRQQLPAALECLRAFPPDIWEPLLKVLDVHNAFLTAMSGAPADAVVAQCEQALADNLLAPDLSALYIVLTALITAGRYRECADQLQRAIRWAQAGGLAVAESFARAYLAVVALRGGDLVETQSELDSGWALARGADHSVASLLGTQLEVHVELDRLDLAERFLARIPVTADMAATNNGLRALYGRARYLLAAGRYQAAIDGFTDLGDLYRRWQAETMLDQPWRSGLARALLAVGNTAQAVELVDEEVTLARSFGAPRPLGIALQAGALLHPDRAMEYAREAVAVLELGEARLELTKAQALLGNLLVAAGERRSGRVLLLDSLEGAAASGADRLTATVRRELMSAGGRPPPLRRTGLRSLTPTERRIAVMVSKEMTNREIARELYVTEKTVESHLTNVFRKIGVPSRGALSNLVNSNWSQTAG